MGNYQFFSGLSALEGAYHWALEVMSLFKMKKVLGYLVQV